MPAKRCSHWCRPASGREASATWPACIASVRRPVLSAHINHVPGGERRSLIMFTPARRLSATLSLLAVALISTLSANAVIVRGTVTDPLGAAVVGARVQLIQGRQVAAVAVTGPDGTFEI